MLKWQDLQIDDVTLWNQLKQLWQAGNYTQALNVLQNTSLATKWQNADNINTLTTELVRLQNQNDPNFKINNPVTSFSSPASPNRNKLWFEVI